MVLEVKEQGEANKYVLAKGDHWVMAIQFNGEYTVPMQKLILAAINKVLFEEKIDECRDQISGS